MDNKSELSKPVAWKLHHHDRYYFEENADVVAIAESVGKAKGDAVYSQEYVSALTQRIAELEEEFAFIMGQNDGMEKELRDKDARIEHLEANLATPVRLPPADSQGRYHGMMTRFAIKKAGFTVEGDE
ncbi:hypothetical protein ACXPJX_000300 [Serratia marcescens]